MRSLRDRSPLGDSQKHKVKMKTSLLAPLTTFIACVCFNLCACDISTKLALAAGDASSSSSLAASLTASLSLGSRDQGESENLLEANQHQASSEIHFEANLPSLVVSSRWQQLVFLPCKLANLNADQTISWIRRADSLVLTVDRLRLIDDPRFQLAQSDAQDDWTLLLASPTEADAGFYECQVSSLEPKLSRLLELRMMEAKSRISVHSSVGGRPLVPLLAGKAPQLQQQQPALAHKDQDRDLAQVLYVKPGDQLNLSCHIEAPEPIANVYWYKNKEVARFDIFQPAKPAEGGSARLVEVASDFYLASALDATEPSQTVAPKVHKASSWLAIKSIQANDSASYKCKPSNAKASQVSLVVMGSSGSTNNNNNDDDDDDSADSQPEKRSLLVSDGARAGQPSLPGDLRRLLAAREPIGLQTIAFCLARLTAVQETARIVLTLTVAGLIMPQLPG